MSGSWTWFCNRCGEGHTTNACPVDASIHSPFQIESDPVETTFPGVTFGAPATANIVHIPSRHQPTADLWLSLVQAMTEQTKAINALIEQNQLLIQALAGEEGAEEVDRYQTL